MADDEHPYCIVCRSDDARLRYRLPEFSIYDCRRCSLTYLWPIPSEEAIRELFSQLYTTGAGSVPELRDYYGYCFDDSAENPLVQCYEGWLDVLEQHHPERGRLLDVGCGTGLFLSVARRRGWKVMGLDESEEATQHARRHFGLDVFVGEFAQLHQAGQAFDAVTGWDMIEHSRDPVAVLSAMAGCLAPGGTVILTTPNQRSILDLLAGAFYRMSGGAITGPLQKFYLDQHFLYFTPDTLAAAMQRSGLEVVHSRLESTDLRRLALAPPMRLLLEAIFAAGRIVGRENRMLLVARAARS